MHTSERACSPRLYPTIIKSNALDLAYNLHFKPMQYMICYTTSSIHSPYNRLGRWSFVIIIQPCSSKYLPHLTNWTQKKAQCFLNNIVCCENYRNSSNVSMWGNVSLIHEDFDECLWMFIRCNLMYHQCKYNVLSQCNYDVKPMSSQCTTM